MKPSAIAHYFGSRQELVEAWVDRAARRCREAFAGWVWSHPPARRLAAAHEFLFGERLADPELATPLRELAALSARDERTRDQLRALYLELLRTCEDAVAASYPRAPAGQRAMVAQALVALGESSATLAGLGFDPRRQARARAAATALVRGLGSPRRVGGRRSAARRLPKRGRP